MTQLPGVSRQARTAVSTALALLLLMTGCSGGGSNSGGGSEQGRRSPTAPGSTTDGPGHVLSSEPYDGLLGDDVRAWRVRYRTTDADGRPREATALVVAPADPEQRGAVVATAHPTTGIAEACAPSTSSLAPMTVVALTGAARRGWVVVAPDYAGLGSPGGHDYLVGRSVAHDVLDAVRATRELVPEADDETVLWGHSQGGHAVLWAGQEAASYAPDMTLSGVAATGVPTDLRALVRRAEDTESGTLVAALVVAAWDRVYPAARVLEQVPRQSRPALEQLAALCLDGRGFGVALGLARQLQGRLLPRSAYDGRLGRLLEQNSPSGRLGVPLFVGQGRADAVVEPDVTRAWVDRACAAGQAVDYREYPGGHGGVGAGSPMMLDVLAWAEARIAGEPVTSTCG